VADEERSDTHKSSQPGDDNDAGSAPRGSGSTLASTFRSAKDLANLYNEPMMRLTTEFERRYQAPMAELASGFLTRYAAMNLELGADLARQLEMPTLVSGLIKQNDWARQFRIDIGAAGSILQVMEQTTNRWRLLMDSALVSSQTVNTLRPLAEEAAKMHPAGSPDLVQANAFVFETLAEVEEEVGPEDPMFAWLKKPLPGSPLRRKVCGTTPGS
jgi:hypothetical protein